MVIRKPSRLLIIGLGCAAAAAVVFACGFNPPEKNPNPPKGGGSCSTEPGSLPPAACDNSLNDCSSAAVCTEGKTSGCCKIEEKCGDQTTCMPLADNKGKTVIDLRMRRLNVAAPASLAEPFIQNVVVTKNLDLKANGKGGTPSCGEDGLGAFNWLLRVDKSANTLTPGGAPPTSDAFNKGYCFYKQQRGGLAIEAVTGPIRFT